MFAVATFGFLAFLGAASSQGIQAQLKCASPGKTAVWNTSSLANVCGGPVSLILFNPSTASIDANVQLFVNQRCAQDETAVNLGASIAVKALGAGENRSIDLSSTSTDKTSLPCGPGCLGANITTGGGNGFIVKAAVVSDCNFNGIDLALVTTLNLSKSYLISQNQLLLNAFPDLKVKLKNNGTVALPVLAKDLSYSVLAVFRTNSIRHEDVVKYASFDQCKTDKKPLPVGPESQDGTGNSPPANMQQNNFMRPTAFEQWFRDWQLGRDNRSSANFPRCANNIFIEGDIPLFGGDILIKGGLDKGAEVDVDLSKVVFEAKRSFCNRTQVNGTLMLIADPIGLTGDSDLCNNVIAIRVNVTCAKVQTNHTCEVLPDPVTRGLYAQLQAPRAAPIHYGDMRLSAPSLDETACGRFDDILENMEQMRWKLLADRYQAQSLTDPSICWDANQAELQREREFSISSINRLLNEMKSQQLPPTTTSKSTAGVNSSGVPTITSKSTAGVNGSSVPTTTSKSTAGVNGSSVPTTTSKSTAGVNGSSVPTTTSKSTAGVNSSGVPTTTSKSTAGVSGENFQTTPKGWTGESTNGEENRQQGGIETQWIELIDLIKSGQPGLNAAVQADILNLVQNVMQQMSRNEYANVSFSERLNISRDFRSENVNACPGLRPKTVMGLLSKPEQMAMVLSHLLRNTNIFKNRPLANNLCGYRKLQEVLSRDGGRFINRDLKRVRHSNSPVDDNKNFRQYLVIANEALRGGAHSDVEAVHAEIDKRMSEADSNELAACGGRQALLDRIYTLDDSVTSYWDVQGGVVYQGVRSPLDPYYGQDVNPKQVVWWPVAACSCMLCSTPMQDGQNFMPK